MRFWPALSVFALLGCDFLSSPYKSNTAARNPFFQKINLVSDTAAFAPRVLDSNLSNPWGLVLLPNGYIRIGDNHKGVSTQYDGTGTPVGSRITIPSGDTETGAPTGVVYNATTDFNLPDSTGRAILIFAGENGTLSAWNSGTAAKLVVTDSGAVFKGIAMASDSGKNFLYLADFKDRKVVVYDKSFQRDTTRLFQDTAIPATFGPFNVVAIGNVLYVTYAKLKGPDNQDDEAGPGNGYVNIFKPNGTLVKRFVTQGLLNSPWAVVSVPGYFGPFLDGIFVGNFGDGTIHVYDNQGNLLGTVQDKTNTDIKIAGLWGLMMVSTSTSTSIYGQMQTALYFTSGPNDENHGLFGLLSQY